ncbi:MAG: NAD+ synthase [Candidatus Zixiibacteriota bacterium]|nr:MAG: NAD+ synthase [candidate division Zixibacteria bacterium]
METFDANKAITRIASFIAEQLEASGLSGYVIGLSGGIDSALSATIAVRAVGPDKLLALMMPYGANSGESLKDAMGVAEWLCIQSHTVNISTAIDTYYAQVGDESQIRRGNKMARERMSILFDFAHRMNRLVLGTGNRTEICLGYTTLYGDAACSINPIGGLYKTEVRLLAGVLGIPEAIINKPPSADLWRDQTDEGEIGVSYDVIDRLLRRIVDEGVTSMAELTRDGTGEESVRRVVSLMNANAFKRNLPPVASLDKPPIPNKVSLQE